MVAMECGRRIGVAMLVAWVSFACGEGRATTLDPAPPTGVDASETAATTPTPSPSPTSTATPAPAARITLAAVGDVMMARSVGGLIESDGPSVVFAGVREKLRSANITVANLETAIGDTGSPRAKSYRFRSPPAAAEALRDGGVDVVSLANNHSLDYGAEALLQTLDLLGEQEIAAVGAGEDTDAARRAHLLTVGGLQLAFLGFVDTPGEGPGYQRSTWEAGEGQPGVAWASTDAIAAAVTAALNNADLVIVLLHNGVEGSGMPSQSQRTYAQAAIDAGAALVLGTHPHVLQPVERYGNGVIVFSLGNFVFDGFDGASNTSAIFEAVLTANGVESWSLAPVSIVNGLPVLDP